MFWIEWQTELSEITNSCLNVILTFLLSIPSIWNISRLSKDYILFLHKTFSCILVMDHERILLFLSL
jgi:hypothetical protein